MSLLDTASLLLTPNAYKEGKLYSVIPSDGSGDFTFTRATTATRVNSDGLVELVPYNLLQRSEEFNNAAWGKSGSGGGLAPVVTANAGTAPDGTMTAERVQFNCVSSATSAFRSLMNQGASAAVGNRYTGSIYVKAFSPSEVGKQLRFVGEGANISTIITITADWQRVVVTGSNSTFTPINYLIETRGTFTTNTTADVLLWGAQLVEGTNALPYQKTETRLNIPRLDYSLGGCPNILLEPQRTNLITYSEQFDDASWGKVNGGIGLVPTVTANTSISPSGLQNADRIQLSLNGGTTLADLSYINKAVSSTSAATFSIYAKSNTTPCTIYFRSGTVATAINITTEWQRFEFYNSGAITVVQFGLRGGSYGGAVNSNTADISVWGAQLEAGAYATSYIPTTTASVTRNADVCVKTGISSLIGQTEGTMFWEGYLKADNIERRVEMISDGTNNNRILINTYTNLIQLVVVSGGVVSANMYSTTYTTGFNKIAAAYKNNDFVLYVNGVQMGSDTSGSVPSCSRYDIGQDFAGTLNNITNVKTAVLWKERLTNDQLAQLTTI